MNGWLKKRDDRKRPDCWSIILDLGAKPGGKGRRQKWITFHGTKQEAKKRLREILGEHDRGEFVEPSKITLGDWLDEWLKKAVKPTRNARTYRTFEVAVRVHLKPKLGAILLQQLRPLDIEEYYASSSSAPETLRLHHTVLSVALKVALRDGLVRRNVAALVTAKPARVRVRASHVWTAEEAKAVLVAAKQTSPQVAAFVALALDSGCRRGELEGLPWSAIDLATGALRIDRQLLKAGENPSFGPTKTGKSRTLDLSAETVGLLREHKRTQAELKLANRLHYKDHGLVFAQAWEHACGRNGELGAPISGRTVNAILEKLVKATKVRRITMHGLRHTSATLLLAAGVQPHVVQRRLGHGSITTTLDQYAHVLPAQQADAASRLAALLYR